MKAISKYKLLNIISRIKDVDVYDLDILEEVLERFGDDYFMIDGQLTKVTTNKKEE